jgi:hypothetical protein
MGLNVDFVDRLNNRQLEVQSRLLDLNKCAIAQKNAALCLINCVPASGKDQQDERAK